MSDTSVSSSKHTRAALEKIQKHADALIKLLETEKATATLIGLQAIPKLWAPGEYINRGSNTKATAFLQMKRRQKINQVCQDLRLLHVSASKALAVPEHWQRAKRSRGRPSGIFELQVHLALQLCHILSGIGVKPQFSAADHEEQSFPQLLISCLDKAGRRAKSGALKRGDVVAVASEALKRWRSSSVK